MSLRQRSYLIEAITGIPFSEFKVGKKVKLERVQIYANPGYVPKQRVVTKVIEKVKEHTGTGDMPFLMVRFKGLDRWFRSAGRGTVIELTSGPPKPLKYEVVEVL